MGKPAAPQQWPADRVERRPIAGLIPAARNARTHSPEQVDQLAASMREWGWTNPVLVDEEGVLIAGHGRVLAAQALGWPEVPVMVAAGWTTAQKRAYALADNKLPLNAGWDADLLAVELDELRDLKFDLSLMGFAPQELNDLIGTQNTGFDPDEVPPAPVVPVSRTGDLWVMGAHRLLCGDSTKPADVGRLMGGAKADMMFTDPPYGVNYEGGHFHSGDVNIKRKRESLAADGNASIYGEFLPVALLFVDGPCYVWFAHSKAYEVFSAFHANQCEISAVLIWHKTNATYAAMNAQYKQRHEPCAYFKPHGSTLRWVGAPDESTLWEEKRDGQNTFHPTQKPVCLAERAIRNHDAPQVYDPFVGSGTTIIAAEMTSRACYALEIAPQYVDVSVLRWQQFTGKAATLDNDGRTFEEVKNAREKADSHRSETAVGVS